MDAQTQEQGKGPLLVLARQVTDALGLEVVELALRGSATRRLVRVDIDRAGPSGVSLEDCQRVSRALERAMDGAGLFPGGYVLEVSSPGIDRPIRTPADVRRNSGRRVVVHTATPFSSRVQFRGTLQGSSDSGIVVDDDEIGEVAIPWEIVTTARQEVGFAAGGIRR